jgi:hypothetical protein
MSQVSHTLSFTYKGNEVEFVPDMLLLRRVRDICMDGRTTLVDLAASISNRKPDMFTMAYALKQMLKKAGIEEEEAECYRWVSSGGGDSPDEITSFMTALLYVIFPNVDVGKKPEAPRVPVVKVKKGPKTKKTTT